MMESRLIASLLMGFGLTCLLAMASASSFGERIYNGWASIWCPSAQKYPTILVDGTVAPMDVMADEEYAACHDRIYDATTTMCTAGLCLLVMYAIFLMWDSFQKGCNNNNNVASKTVRFWV